LPAPTSDVVAPAAGLRPEDDDQSASSMPQVSGQQSPAVSRSQP
jgi:hypothetical protein